MFVPLRVESLSISRSLVFSGPFLLSSYRYQESGFYGKMGSSPTDSVLFWKILSTSKRSEGCKPSRAKGFSMSSLLCFRWVRKEVLKDPEQNEWASDYFLDGEAETDH